MYFHTVLLYNERTEKNPKSYLKFVSKQCLCLDCALFNNIITIENSKSWGRIVL